MTKESLLRMNYSMALILHLFSVYSVFQITQMYLIFYPTLTSFKDFKGIALFGHTVSLSSPYKILNKIIKNPAYYPILKFFVT